MELDNKNPYWWKRHKALERRLIIISVLAVAAVIGLLLGFVSVIFSKQITEFKLNKVTEAAALHGNISGTLPPAGAEENVCLSAECIHTASSVLRMMKAEADPCDDFYKFACGTFLEETVIPEDAGSVKAFDLHDLLREQLEKLITEERPLTDLKYLRMPNLLYKACMNKTLIEQLGSGPIKKIADSIGGWPLLMGEAWDADNSWSWHEAAKKFRRLGFSKNYIIDLSITLADDHTTKLLQIDETATSLSRESFVNETLVTSYFSYMVDMAVLFGANKTVATKELRESLQFEMDLANISIPSEERLSTIGQLQKSYPYVQWLDYINALLPKGLTVDEDEPINVVAPTFFDALAKLLARTPKRVIANYMMWRIHEESIEWLSDEFRKREQEYAGCREEQHSPSAKCINPSIYSFRIAVGSLYVRKHFKEDSKVEAMEIVKNIRESFQQRLAELDWIDDKTKKRAKVKLHSMTIRIGYPDELLDDSKIAEYYQNLSVDPECYFESMLRIKVFETDDLFNNLRLPLNKTEWQSHATPTELNAYYSPTVNSVDVYAIMLQGQFFNARRPKYMNYGSIGSTIGHEIAHGLDDQGHPYDLEGWEPQAEETYQKKSKCIMDQYSNFTEPLTGLNLNGLLTLRENIADNAAIKASYLAYRRWAMKNGPESKLPGLDYTPEQMFWISYGQSECSKATEETMKNLITDASHSPDYFRVIGPIRNTKYFAKDFHCPEGSPMNPVQKCELW